MVAHFQLLYVQILFLNLTEISFSSYASRIVEFGYGWLPFFSILARVRYNQFHLIQTCRYTDKICTTEAELYQPPSIYWLLQLIHDFLSCMLVIVPCIVNVLKNINTICIISCRIFSRHPQVPWHRYLHHQHRCFHLYPIR